MYKLAAESFVLNVYNQEMRRLKTGKKQKYLNFFPVYGTVKYRKLIIRFFRIFAE